MLEITSATVEKIHITNFRMIADLEIQVGTLTLIQGGNHAGKTSVLAACRSLLAGGHDPEDIRQGQKRYEITMDLATNAGALSIKKVGTKSQAQYTITLPDGTKTKESPVTFIKSLIQQIDFDPMDFLRQPDKQKLETLLAKCPVSITEKDINAFITYPEAKALVDGTTLTLEGIDDRIKMLMEQRRKTNSARESASNTETQLKQQLEDMGYQGRQTEAIADDLAKTLNAASAAEKQALQEIQLKYDGLMDDIRKEIARLNDRLLELQAERSTSVNALNESIDAKYNPIIQQLREELTVAEEAQKRQAGNLRTQQMIESFQKTVKELAIESRNQDDAINALRQARAASLTNSLPKGLSIQDGVLYYQREDDVSPVPFDSTNQAEQIITALRVSSRGDHPLGFLIIDGLESLDDQTLANFRQRVLDSGMQLIAAKVTDGQLSVETQ